MKCAVLFIGLVLTVSSALGAALPETENTGNIATSSDDADSLAHHVRSVEDPGTLVARDIWSITAERVEEVVSEVISDMFFDETVLTEDRGVFTKRAIERLYKEWSDVTWIMVHPKHLRHPDPGTEWRWYAKEFRNGLDTTIRYEIYAFQSGSFELIGDSGWQNWAYAGKNVVRDGKILYFS